jgi:hypothetical protein
MIALLCIAIYTKRNRKTGDQYYCSATILMDQSTDTYGRNVYFTLALFIGHINM